MRSAAIVALLCLLPAAAGAQSANLTPAQNRVALEKSNYKIATPGSPSTARPGAEAILQGASDDSSVKIRVGANLSESWFIDGIATAPLDESAIRTTAATASDLPLAADARFSVGFGMIRYRPKFDSVRADSICKDVTSRGLGRCATDNKDLPASVILQLRKTIEVGRAYAAGVRASVGRKEFTIKEVAAAAVRTETHNSPVSVMGSAGVLLSSGIFLGTQVGFERSYKGADPVQFCEQVPNRPDLSTCTDTLAEAPEEREGVVVVLEARRFFKRAAIAPRFEYRKTKDLKLFELPCYFLSDPEGNGWTGGVSFQIKNGDPSVLVFVGPTLNLFGF